MMAVINVDEAFCEKILQTHQQNKSIKVLEIKKNIATAKGDNYLSKIYRIFVKYNIEKNGIVKNNEETSLIVKTKGGLFGLGSEIVDQAFRNETHILKNVLPMIEKNIGCSVGPLLYFCDENTNYIVMEDLGRQGYAMGDKFEGLSFEHCLKAIEKMAKFHAGSVAIAERDPHLLKAFDGVSGLRASSGKFFKFVESTLANVSNNIAENWKENEYQEIACKLKKLAKEIRARLTLVFKHETDEFCALNHGDFWINNVMFKNNKEGKPCDARMIDFQVISYTSPALDLQHFLAMCPELELKGDKEDCFLKSYLTVLKNTMKKTGCKTSPPTIEQLKKAMQKRGVYSVLTGLVYCPGLLANKNDIEGFSDSVETGESNVDIFKEPFAVKTVRKVAKLFNDRGYLD